MTLPRRAWAFTLDGHVFYVLGAHAGKTLVCDLTTGQWHLWYTGEQLFWNMHNGIMWRGLILAGDAELPRVWLLDPETADDEGTSPIARVVTGFQPARGRGSQTIGSLRVTASVGDPSTPAAAVRMRFSDDEGETWSRYYDITLNQDDFAQVLRFRSLGRLRSPGRLWEISDTGGLVRIDGADCDAEQ